MQVYVLINLSPVGPSEENNQGVVVGVYSTIEKAEAARMNSRLALTLTSLEFTIDDPPQYIGT